MFDQTFVDGQQKTNKPLSLLVSTVIQICVLGVILLIPLIYNATLPGAMFKSFLLAPRPPVASVPSNVHRVPSSRFIKVFNGHDLIAPTAVPHQVNSVDQAGPPPDLAAGGTLGSTDNPLGASLLASPDMVAAAPPPPPEAKSKPATSGPIHVSTGAAEAQLITKVLPAYPQLAKSARIQGIVEFTAIISKQGNIENLQLLRGHPLLVNAARNAVLAWKYRPTLLNGEPVEVRTEIIVNFTLTQ